MPIAIKKMVEHLPYSIGRFLAKVPFRYRLGSEYEKYQSMLLENPQQISPDYVILNFDRIFQFAKTNFPFYSELYKKHGVYDLKIHSLDDIRSVPIITKDMLRSSVSSFRGAYKVNTGGTSGTPFAFYLDKNAYAREWAHMHHIWGLKGYRYTDLKLTFRGKNLGDRSIIYNPVHNEFVVNTYHPTEKYFAELVELVARESITFLHGYPSAIYIFLKEAEVVATEQQMRTLKENLKTCLFSSEFPASYMVEYISNVWGFEYISWYGHSEMCILAYDLHKNNQYIPLHSYGFTEEIDGHLIGTSYHNHDMPLIRYDTGDLVESTGTIAGISQYFTVKEGRNGDFIRDRSGKLVPLTALIFGRHHDIFTHVNTIQLSQTESGLVQIYVTGSTQDKNKLLSLLDLSGVDAEFELVVLPAPYLTPAGKMPLKIQPLS